jgi:hypothetical protein
MGGAVEIIEKKEHRRSRSVRVDATACDPGRRFRVLHTATAELARSGRKRDAGSEAVARESFIFVIHGEVRLQNELETCG